MTLPLPTPGGRGTLVVLGRVHHSQLPAPQQEREHDDDTDGAPESACPSVSHSVDTLRGGAGRHGRVHGPLRGGLYLDHDQEVSSQEAQWWTELSSPGFCGGWFIWFRWLPVVIVPGGGGRGGCRAPRRLRARRGFAYRWRSVAGWCPPSGPTRRWRARAASMSSQGPWLRISSALYKELERLGQSKAERNPPSTPPRRLPRSRTGQPRSEWTSTAPHGRKWCTRPVRSAPARFRCQTAI